MIHKKHFKTTLFDTNNNIEKIFIFFASSTVGSHLQLLKEHVKKNS